jgi:NADPH:quinone reductase-like Zn-dependent oxidoreductase
VRAVVQDAYGPAEVLELREIAEPVPGHGQVRVRVRAAGCGPDVWHLMTGKPLLARIAPDFRKLWPFPRGRDVAGVVDDVGEGVSDLQPGEEVMGIVEGSFADLAVGERVKVVRKPDRLSFVQAAAVPISGLTALRAVRDVAAIRPGQRVLVVGAGGGVGSLAVQIAVAMDARVTGVAGGAKRDLVMSLGAEDMIDYAAEDFTDGRRQWDAIIDTAGRRPLHRLGRALTRTGTAAIVGGDGGGDWTGGFFRQILRGPLLSAVSRRSYRPVIAQEEQDDLLAMAELIDAGKLTPIVDCTFDLAKAADAVRYLAQGHAAGKVVVTI